jgi:hypothetical protein
MQKPREVVPETLPNLDPIVGDTDPIPIDVAAAMFFPHGGIKTATLFAAIRKGRLAVEKVGKAYFVTRHDIEEWRKSCRVERSPRASTLGDAPIGSPNGSSEMETQNSSLAVANAMSAALRNVSRDISHRGSTQIPGNVIRPRFKSRKS